MTALIKKYKIKLGPLTFCFMNWYEFIYLYFEIFVFKEYSFVSNKEVPLILDCGAHIGIAVLFFKQKYPNAIIIAFEPQQTNVSLLKQNITENKLKDVTIISSAVSNHVGNVPLYTSGANKSSWGNSLQASSNSAKVLTETVSVIKLSSYLEQKIDFLKMDIEWVEEDVLREIEPKIGNVQELVIEIHNQVGSTNNRLLFVKKFLEKQLFQVRYKKPFQIALGEFLKKIIGKNSTDIYILHAWK